MNYQLSSQSATQIACDCLVLSVGANNQLSPSGQALDKQTGGAIKRLLKQGDLGPEVGQTLLWHPSLNGKATRLLFVRTSKEKSVSATDWLKLCKTVMQVLQTTQANHVALAFAEIAVTDKDTAWQLYQCVLACENALYRFNDCKSKKDNTAHPLRKLTFLVKTTDKQIKQLNRALTRAQAVGNGMQLTKTLGNLPGNICTPSYLAKQAQQLSKQFKTIKTSILNEAEMKKLGMHSLLSVAKGSHEPAKLITLQYRGKKTGKPVVLVGKGITFDSGGISLKPGAGMDEMKFDMCGAASVLGTLHAAAQLKLPINIVGVIASSENLPGGAASKPGDIVTSMSKQTIEILNTDAEGRLVLCDALTYCEKFQPDVVIDIATLTGAMVIALGPHPTGMMSNADELANDLLAAGQACHDRVWRLPLWEEYQSMLSSNFADMANIGGRAAGSITAACFLARFTKKYRWAHLDIAGTAWNSGDKEKGATGRPVPLLIEYLARRCHAA